MDQTLLHLTHAECAHLAFELGQTYFSYKEDQRKCRTHFDDMTQCLEGRLTNLTKVWSIFMITPGARPSDTPSTPPVINPSSSNYER